LSSRAADMPTLTAR